MNNSMFHTDVGTPVTATFTTSLKNSGGLANPATVTATVKAPDDTETVYTWPPDGSIVNTSTGVFTLDIPTMMAGIWTVRWVATGTTPDEPAVTKCGYFGVNEACT